MPRRILPLPRHRASRPERLAAAVVVLVACFAGAPAAQAPAGGTAAGGVAARERVVHTEAESAARLIRCDCGCVPQSAWECACGHAAGMVEAMEREARGGATADEIVAGYIEREGLAILLEPPASGWNLTAWLGPSVAILVTAVLLATLLGVWRRRGGGGHGGPRGEAPDDDYRRQALEELDRFDRGDLA